jgi:hypothetical protein
MKSIFTEHLIIISNDAYREERETQENIATLHTQETTLRENMLAWRGEMGVWQEKNRRAVNRSNLKMPKFTGQPKSIAIFEFRNEWLEYKRAAALTKQEGLAELKQAIQTTQRKAVLDMKEEEEIFTHLMVLFGNPKLLLA